MFLWGTFHFTIFYLINFFKFIQVDYYTILHFAHNQIQN